MPYRADDAAHERAAVRLELLDRMRLVRLMLNGAEEYRILAGMMGCLYMPRMVRGLAMGMHDSILLTW